MRCLLIDDERDVALVTAMQGYKFYALWDVAKTYEEAISFLENDEKNYDLVTFDHDLGQKKTGYDVMNWLEKRVLTTSYCPDMKLEVHTANLSAYGKMVKLADRIMKLSANKRYALDK